MMKYFKLLGLASFTLVGLYFFGDFRINDTNVRDFLRRHITVQNFRAIKNQTVQLYTLLKDFNQARKNPDSFNQTIQKALGDSVDLKNLPVDGLSSLNSLDSLNIKDLPLDNISKTDKDKLIKLLEEHLNSQVNGAQK